MCLFKDYYSQDNTLDIKDSLWDFDSSVVQFLWVFLSNHFTSLLSCMIHESRDAELCMLAKQNK